MNIIDFLPKYASIEESRYDVLNPYQDSFYDSLFKKKEFYENRLDKTQVFPQERGLLTKYQKTIVRYMSSHTPYDKVILIHSMGSGKTCSAIGAIEQIRQEDSKFDSAMIFAKGSHILDNFLRELIERCTAGGYIPDGYNKMSMREKMLYGKKKAKFYQLRTFARFAKKLKSMPDSEIVDLYSNKIIVVDEVHNIRIQDKKKEEDVMTYEQFHRFLHIVKNCKIIFLSGTPMKDSPAEIASVANLLLPLNNQFPTEEEFMEEYMYEEKGTFLMKEDKIPDFKSKMKGLVSFLRESTSSIPKEFIGETHFGNLKHFVVEPSQMSSFQTHAYLKALKKDKSGQAGVYINSREASLFVYPDGSWGKEGFKKYLYETKTSVEDGSTISSFKMKEELLKSVKGENDKDTLQNIKKYSCTYYRVIKEILKTEGNCFTYSSIVQGSGAIIFSLLLGLFGFKKANGSEKKPGLRYAILTNKTVSTSDIRKIVERFNRPDNIHGEIIKVIIGSRSVSEGFSFKNVLFESINTPHWNYSETAQALARGIRLGSHNDLLKEGLNPVVKILQPVAIPKDSDTSIDLQMYQTSEDKDITIRRILRLLMELAFDCGLNYLRNHVNGKKGSRDCDYLTCNYTCDGLNMEEVINGVDEKDLDFSTYQLYYANPKIPLIRKKIEQLFREKNQLDFQAIYNNLKDKFSEEEIKNALVLLEEESESEQFDYKGFLNVYSRSSVKQIMNGIEELFKDNFKLPLNSIIEHFPNKTQFEILTALRELINNSVIFTNKYGLPCYLREEQNVYFLVTNIAIKPDYFTEFYTKYPSITVSKNFTEIMEQLFSLSLPRIIKQLCKTKDNNLFVQLMKSLPPPVQEMFIEASLIAKKNGSDVAERVLNLYKTYIKKIGKNSVSTFVEPYRCLEKGSEEWKDCPEIKDKIIEKEQQKLEELKENNPYGVIGKYNPENDAFCIIDFNIEEKTRKNISEKREKGKTDRRLSHSGKVCKSWQLKDLVNFAVNRLEIEPPLDFMLEESDSDMIDLILDDDTLMKTVTRKQVKNADTDTLRRMCYWGLPKSKGGIRSIEGLCKGLKAWFEEKGLLIEDNQCGVQGKKKSVSGKKEQKDFLIEVMVPENEVDRFNSHMKNISALFLKTLKIKKFKVKDSEDHTWVLAYLGKKLVGTMSLDSNGELHNVCASEYYRKKQIADQAMSTMYKQLCRTMNVSPVLKVDNKDKKSDKQVKKYEDYGFRKSEVTDKYTIMVMDCS